MAGLPFILLVWIVTRAAIFTAMFWLSPAHSGWTVFTHWDGQWYEHIATAGYEYAPDGMRHAVAFFPLYPLAVAALMHVLPLPFVAVAPLVNNLAFFVALTIVYAWVRERCDVATARWTVATLCIVPTSLFTAIAYSEGLFMALSAAALRWFDRGAYAPAAAAAALASATRLFGALLFPAFALAAYRTRRGAAAYLCALSALAGTLGFALFCASAFGDPLAFVHVQGAWRTGLGFSFPDWEYVFAYGITWRWPYQIAIVAVGYWWLRKRRSMNAALSSVVAFALGVAELTLWGKEQLTFLFIGLGCVLVIRYRTQLGVAATTYALTAIAVLLFSGKPFSAERLAYAVVPLSVALGIFWRRFPALGTAALAVVSVDLPLYAIRYAEGIFVD